MKKTKIEFIKDLLNDSRLNPLHKERLVLLASSELKRVGKVSDIVKETSGKKAVDLLTEHNPISTAHKLSLFKTGSNLKWITHVFPNTDIESFDYKRITHNAINEFNSISEGLPLNLIGIISLFLKRRKGNSSLTTFTYLGDQYKTWWSDDIKNWCAANKTLHPDTNQVLSDQIIMPFKKSIEIREGEDLIVAIKHKLMKTHDANIFDELNVDFSGVKKSTRFFTGVDDLMTGIRCLFLPIINRRNVSNNIRISTSGSEINGRYVTILSITHLNSDVENEFSDVKLLNGDLGSAKNKFLSLCDWNIIANFQDGTYRIPVLKSGDQQLTKLDTSADGFTHELIFY